MFQRWGFLLGEIWLLLLLATLLGLLAGWLIWGRTSASTDTAEADRLRAELDRCTAKGRDQSARITALESDIAAAKSTATSDAAKAESAKAEAAKAEAAKVAAAKAEAAKAETAQADAAKAEAAKTASTKSTASKPTATPSAAQSTTAAAPTAATTTPPAKAAAPKPAAPKPTPSAADKPKSLTKARNDAPDDLKLIKGIGPKLEQLCHKLGYFHFDQIAAWTAKEIAWVDDNLEGFKGRVTRDEWVAQARDLMNGAAPRPGGEG